MSSKALRVLCLGAGATGGYYGGRLLQAKAAEVSFLVRTAEQANKLTQHGLKVLSAFYGDVQLGDIHAFASVHDDVAQRPYDIILLSCKSYDLESACQSLDPFVSKHPNAIVLPILNGMAHMEFLEKRYGAERVIGGTSHVASVQLETGVIKQLTNVHRITFGAKAKRLPHTDEVLKALRDAFEKTIVEVRLVDNIEQELWEKFMLLSTLAASTCTSRASVGDMMSTDEGEYIVKSILSECVAAATHAGFPPQDIDKNPMFGRLFERDSVLTASMMRDMEADRPTEAKHIVFDMLQRTRATGNPGTYLGVAWFVLQARNERLFREKGIRHKQ